MFHDTYDTEATLSGRRDKPAGRELEKTQRVREKERERTEEKSESRGTEAQRTDFKGENSTREYAYRMH